MANQRFQQPSLEMVTESMPLINDELPSSPVRSKVVIVGAGAAGLQCAQLLVTEYGLLPDDVIILEARNRVGGRIHTVDWELQTVNDSYVSIRRDLGAAWVHGTGLDWGADLAENEDKAIPMLNPMMKLLERATGQGQSLYDVHLDPVFSGNPCSRPRTVLHKENKLAIFVAGQLVNKNSPAIQAALERYFLILSGLNAYACDLRQQGLDKKLNFITLEEAMAAVQQNDILQAQLHQIDKEYLELTLQLTSFHFHLAEVWRGTPASEIALSEFVHDDAIDDDTMYVQDSDFYGPHCRLKQGMSAVIGPLLCNKVSDRVCLNQQVIKIKLDDDGVSLQTLSGLTVHAAACVSTLSVGCLQEAVTAEKRLFEPSLSSCKNEYLSSTTMGSYKKVFLTFSYIFWPPNDVLIGMVVKQEDNHQGRPLGNFLIALNCWAKDGMPCLEIDLVGKAAAWATGRSEDEIVEAVLDFIAEAMGICDKLKDLCIDHLVTRWEEDPFSRGAYSDTANGAAMSHIEGLRKTEWGGRLVFAGEATVPGLEGSVYGALISGHHAAKNISEYLTSQ